MTRTSIELESHATRTRAQRQGERRFRRALLGTLAVLAVLCAGLGIVAAQQGPRVSGMQVDTAAVAERPGQQLRLFANQLIADVEADQVTVEPDVAVTVAVTGDILALTFQEALRYDTTYSVRVEGVTNPYASTTGVLEASFTTAPAAPTLLQRSTPSDLVVRVPVPGAPEGLFADERIQSFAMLKDAIAVSLVGPDLRGTLSIASLDGQFREEVPLPEDTLIRGMAVDPGGTVLGFQATSLEGGGFAPDTLVTVDLSAGRRVVPVAGLDGAPLRVVRWLFEPDGGILALGTDGMLTRVAADGAVLPLGRFTELGTLSPDGTRVVVGDQGGIGVLTLADGTVKPLELGELGGATAMHQTVRLLPGGGTLVGTVQATSSVLTSAVVLVDAAGQRPVLELAGGSIVEVAVSPNGQYAAVAIIPDVSDSFSDGYGAEAMSTSVQTVILDLDRATEVTRLPGFALQW